MRRRSAAARPRARRSTTATTSTSPPTSSGVDAPAASGASGAGLASPGTAVAPGREVGAIGSGTPSGASPLQPGRQRARRRGLRAELLRRLRRRGPRASPPGTSARSTPSALRERLVVGQPVLVRDDERDHRVAAVLAHEVVDRGHGLGVGEERLVGIGRELAAERVERDEVARSRRRPRRGSGRPSRSPRTGTPPGPR